MAYKRKTASRKGTRRPRSYAPRRARGFGKKTSFAQRVQRIISKNIENKNHQSYATNVAMNYASAGGLLPLTISLVPGLNQSVTQGGRLGNEIMIKKGTIKGYINMLPYNATTNPCQCPVYVKMWLCRRKTGSLGITGPPVSSDFNQFFAVGASAVGFQTSPLDLVFSINKDYWSVFASKTIQLQNFSSALPSSAIIGQSSKVSLPFSFNFAKHLGKLYYNDSVSSQPTNKELYLVFQNILSDGTSTAISSTEVHYNIEWTYEDA